MPYLEKDRLAVLIADPSIANTVGDYNALYTMAYLRAFLTNPRYETIHYINKASRWPATIAGVQEVDSLLGTLGVAAFDMDAARELAFLEFYQRIGAPYENLARTKNGDLQLYKEAQEKLFEIAKELALKQSALGGKK